MNETENPTLDALVRLGKAKSKLDQRAHEILAYHLALEREMNLTLEGIMPYASRLHGLGFGHKIGVIGAACDWPERTFQYLKRILMAYNSLRNSIAHGDDEKKLNHAILKLAGATGLPDMSLHDTPSLAAALAMGLLSRIGSGSEPWWLHDPSDDGSH